MTAVELTGHTGNDRISGAIAWCNTQYGSSTWEFSYKDVVSNAPKYQFKFSNEKHAVMFALKWLSK